MSEKRRRSELTYESSDSNESVQLKLKKQQTHITALEKELTFVRMELASIKLKYDSENKRQLYKNSEDNKVNKNYLSNIISELVKRATTDDRSVGKLPLVDNNSVKIIMGNNWTYINTMLGNVYTNPFQNSLYNVFTSTCESDTSLILCRIKDRQEDMEYIAKILKLKLPEIINKIHEAEFNIKVIEPYLQALAESTNNKLKEYVAIRDDATREKLLQIMKCNLYILIISLDRLDDVLKLLDPIAKFNCTN